MGHFRPSHPITRRELESRGVRNLERLTQPYIRQVCRAAGRREGGPMIEGSW